jgi:hypothetical protein
VQFGASFAGDLAILGNDVALGEFTLAPLAFLGV